MMMPTTTATLLLLVFLNNLPSQEAGSSSFLRRAVADNDDEGIRNVGYEVETRTYPSQALILQEAKELTEQNHVLFEEALVKLSNLEKNVTMIPTEVTDLFLMAEKATEEASLKFQEVLAIYEENRKEAKYAGCDGIDQNGQFGADDCMEDQFPPSIEFTDCVPWKVPCDFEGAKCIERFFQSTSDASNYLSSVVKVSDDCAHPEDLSLDIIPIAGGCGDTVFELTPKHTCGNEVFDGTSIRVVVGVDEVPPEVDCGFDTRASSWKGSLPSFVDGNYLMMVEQSSVDLLEVPFFYHMTDNCAGSVSVDVAVSSNALTREKSMVMSSRMSTPSTPPERDVTSLLIAVSPKTCQKEKAWCVQSAAIRYYEFAVTAKDKAGHVSKARCFLGIQGVDRSMPLSSGLNELRNAASSSSEPLYELGDLRLEIATSGPQSEAPSDYPSDIPSTVPSDYPSDTPSTVPTFPPSANPSDFPSIVPTFPPSAPPSDSPSFVPTYDLSDMPSSVPSLSPSQTVTSNPSDNSPSDDSISSDDSPSQSPSEPPVLTASDKKEPVGLGENCPPRRVEEVNEYTFVAFNLPKRPSGAVMTFPSGRYADIKNNSTCYKIFFFGLQFSCDSQALEWVMERGFLFTGVRNSIDERCTNMTSLIFDHFEYGLTSSLP